MLKTLNWYIAKNFLLTFLMAMGVLTFGMTGARLIKVFDYISNGVSADVAFSFMLYVLPVATAFTIPWAALVAIMLVFGRLSADNEITAMRACGISILQIVAPIIMICFILTCCCLYLQLELGPRWLGKARNVIKHVIVDQPLAMFEPGIPVEFDQYRILIDRKDTVTRPINSEILADNGELEKLQLYEGKLPENNVWTADPSVHFALPKSIISMKKLREGQFFTTTLNVQRMGARENPSVLRFLFKGTHSFVEMSLSRKANAEQFLLTLKENGKVLCSGRVDEALFPAAISFSVNREGHCYITIAALNLINRNEKNKSDIKGARVRMFDTVMNFLFVKEPVVRCSVRYDSVPGEKNELASDYYANSVSVMKTFGRIYGVQFIRADGRKLEQDVTAAQGRIVTDTEAKVLHIILENATVMAYEKPGDLHPRRTFSREVSFDIEYGKEFNSERIGKRDKHEGFRQLYARTIIERERAIYDPKGSRERLTEIETELNQRVALALAPIAFLLLGLPLAIRTSRRETSIGLFISVILAVVYFMAVLVSDTFSSTPNAFPQYMVWIPPALYELFGIYYLIKIARN